MTAFISPVIITASACMFMSILSAWIIVSIRILKIKKINSFFQDAKSLVKAHVDYAMMSGLLFIFYLLFTYFSVKPSLAVIISLCTGSFINPLIFIIAAVKPDVFARRKSIAGLIMFSGFILTSAGYLTSIIHIIAAIK